MNASILLVCAVVVSLAVGVLLAYGLCRAMFGLFRIHVQQVAGKRVAPAAAPLQVAGQ